MNQGLISNQWDPVNPEALRRTMHPGKTYTHRSRLGCLYARPPKEFEPPISQLNVSYETQRFRPDTSSIPRHPYALVQGLPEQSQIAGDERQFNQFWYGSRLGDTCDHLMTSRWSNFTMSLRE